MIDNDDLGENEIEVMPTKALFVDMLTRDIGLNRAILDLIDNSIDGARRLRPERDADLTGLQIDITVDEKTFGIEDNCGGIGIDLARRYAFRIGRPRDMPQTPNSVGQFGVGMKRALFKFGRQFSVESTTQADRFTMHVDVDDWENDDSGWRLKFDKTERDLNLPLSDTGTRIHVARLRSGVGENFSLGTFRNALAREIQLAQQQYLDRGLMIRLNGITMLSAPWFLLQSSALAPARYDRTVTVSDGGDVHTRIFAGVADPDPRQAGWYIYCNGRMVLEADQSAATGWGKLADSRGVVAPKYHNQFARFRGYTFFDAENAALLPWNTTKTGVDEDSPLYQSILLTMVEAMRPILDFCRRLDEETDAPDNERPFTHALAQSARVRLREISRVGPFHQPPRVTRTGPPMTTIQYSRPRDQIDVLREALNASSAREVGQMSFDLVYRQHGGSN